MSDKYGEYKIIKYCYKKNGEKYYKAKFLKTGTEIIACYSNLVNRDVKDKYFPIIFDIGCVGEIIINENKRKLYDTWRCMLSRCYNEKDNNYKYYGEKGVSVDKRWRCFENFYDDIKFLKGWDEEKFINWELHLDKDKLQSNINHNEKIYSKDTCCWLDRKENSELQPSCQRNFKAISPSGEIYYASNQAKFARENNLNSSSINVVLHGKQDNHKGWKFNFIEEGEIIQ